MELTLVNPTPIFYCQCVDCGIPLVTDRNFVYADLDGKPFKAYYCAKCAEGMGVKIDMSNVYAGVLKDKDFMRPLLENAKDCKKILKQLEKALQNENRK